MPKVHRYGGTKQMIAEAAEAVEALERRKASEGYSARIAMVGSMRNARRAGK